MAYKPRSGKLAGIVAVALAFCIVAAMQALANGEGVPFKAVLTGTADWNLDLATSPRFQGTGTVTHMGLTANEGIAYLDGLIETNACESGVGLPNMQTEVLTASNGDELVFEIVDLACQDPNDFFVFHGNGTWQVTGGTGRFANASGSGTMEGRADFAAGIFDCTLVGEVTY